MTRTVLEEIDAAYPDRDLQVRYEGDGTGEWDADLDGVAGLEARANRLRQFAARARIDRREHLVASADVAEQPPDLGWVHAADHSWGWSRALTPGCESRRGATMAYTDCVTPSQGPMGSSP